MKLTSIGYLGSHTVYVDLPREVAIQRFNAENPDWTFPNNRLTLREFEVTDSFEVYDLWAHPPRGLETYNSEEGKK